MLDKGIVIIGGGPVGLTLALSLRANNISCKIFERNPGSSILGGSISLAPNALRILEDLGLYGEIRSEGFPLQHTWLKKPDCEVSGKFFYGHEETFGYDAIRIERKQLMRILNSKAKAWGIDVTPKTFSGTTKDSSNGQIVCHFADGTAEEASLLIGADGIHSSVRSLIPGNSECKPAYTGFLALNTVVDHPELPESYLLPCLQLTDAGGIILGPDDASGRRIFVATQLAMPDRTRQEWDQLRKDPQSLREMLKSKTPHCNPVVQDILKKIDGHSNITFWPFHVIPPLDAWTTPEGDMAIIGDAAHAIPPTLGQGIAQGIEDGFLLAQVLARVQAERSDQLLPAAMQLWQNLRQARIHRISRLSKLVGTRLLPPHVQEKMQLRGDEEDELAQMWETQDVKGADMQRPQHPEALSWLYSVALHEELDREWSKRFGELGEVNSERDVGRSKGLRMLVRAMYNGIRRRVSATHLSRGL